MPLDTAALRVSDPEGGFSPRLAEIASLARDVASWQTWFTTFADNTPAILCIKDDALKWVWGNVRFCEALRRPLTDLIGRGDPDLFPPEEAARMRDTDILALRDGAARFYEAVVMPDGLPHRFLVHKFAFPEQGRRWLGVIAFDMGDTDAPESRDLRDDP